MAFKVPTRSWLEVEVKYRRNPDGSATLLVPACTKTLDEWNEDPTGPPPFLVQADVTTTSEWPGYVHRALTASIEEAKARIAAEDGKFAYKPPQSATEAALLAEPRYSGPDPVPVLDGPPIPLAELAKRMMPPSPMPEIKIAPKLVGSLTAATLTDISPRKNKGGRQKKPVAVAEPVRDPEIPPAPPPINVGSASFADASMMRPTSPARKRG